MRNVDDLMATCPLKHEIRVKLWESYINKLNKSPISYLTLYSPPIMDVKYFAHKNFIAAKDGVYSKVVGVGIDADAEAITVSNLDNRLELLLSGDINTLISGTSSHKLKVKQLESKFPFDVINLDYTDPLHSKARADELSPHIKAIESIFRKQSKGNVNEFILLLTTESELDDYNADFIADLKQILQDNINTTPGFAERLSGLIGQNDAEECFNNQPRTGFAISLIKYILKFMGDHGFEMAEGDIKWLVRDTGERPREKHMLHVAFHVKKFVPPPITNRSQAGSRTNHNEQKAISFIRNRYHTLKESSDKERLSEIHSAQILQLNQSTFEISIPEPTTE